MARSFTLLQCGRFFKCQLFCFRLQYPPMVATHLLRPLGAGMAIFVSEAANPARVNYYQVYSYNFNIFPSSCGSQEECFLVQVCVHAYCVCMCVCEHTCMHALCAVCCLTIWAPSSPLCLTTYWTQPSSVEFLRSHSFDFHKVSPTSDHTP